LTKITNTDILIIGSGLSGLSLAYFLSKRNITSKIIEARSRIGGRIETVSDVSGCLTELGATWLGEKHMHLSELLKELSLPVFNQEFGSKAIFEPISTSPPYLALLPQNSDPSLRIVGGTSRLIQTLMDKVGRDHVSTEEQVISIEDSGQTLKVKTNHQIYFVKSLISTLPPNLFVNTIAFTPKLPKEFVALAQNTHTWMADSIKVGFSYERPFWKDLEKSGTIMSNVGPVHEMYEHNDVENSSFALVGFLNGSFYELSTQERKEMILKQLNKYYGSVVNDYLAYNEKVWRHDPWSYHSYLTHVTPHQNNGHPMFKQALLGGKLIIGGSETSSVFPGYMEGAIYRSKEIAQLF